MSELAIKLSHFPSDSVEKGGNTGVGADACVGGDTVGAVKEVGAGGEWGVSFRTAVGDSTGSGVMNEIEVVGRFVGVAEGNVDGELVGLPDGMAAGAKENNGIGMSTECLYMGQAGAFNIGVSTVCIIEGFVLGVSSGE